MLKTQFTAFRLVDTAPDTVARFWASIRCPPIGNACWSWRPERRRGCEPVLSIRGRPVHAARIAHYAVTGDWPLAYRRIRTCSNPLCVRPSHGRWQLGTTTRRALDALEVSYREVSTPVSVEMEIAAARRAGVIDQLWAAD